MTTKKFTDTIFGELFNPADTAGATVMGTAMRLLAKGQPITVKELASAAGVSAAEIESAPAAGDIEYDDRHRIVGWGLTLNPTQHSFTVGSQQLYTWCAGDTLVFPAVLGESAHVESRCPVTGQVIRLTVDPSSGISELNPGTAVVSLPGPSELDKAQVRATTCDPGRYFATVKAGADWQARHPKGVLLPVADAYEQLRSISESFFSGTGESSCC